MFLYCVGLLVVSMRSDCPTCVFCRFWLRVRPVCDWCQASTRTHVTKHSKTCFQAPGTIWASTWTKLLRRIRKSFCWAPEHIPNSCYQLAENMLLTSLSLLLSTCRNAHLTSEWGIRNSFSILRWSFELCRCSSDCPTCILCWFWLSVGLVCEFY